MGEPLVDLDSLSYAVNGVAGTVVSCTLQESAPGSLDFSLTAEVTTGAAYFAVEARFGTLLAVEPDAAIPSGTATIAWYNHQTQTSALASANCLLVLVEASPERGRLAFTFDCPDLVSTQQPQAECRGTGTFVFDHCALSADD